jgi:hypothetical protein
MDPKKNGKVREMNALLVKIEAAAHEGLKDGSLDPNFYGPVMLSCHELRETFHKVQAANE